MTQAKIVSLVEEGIRTFDTSHRTCLQTDWNKYGIGYLLLQQYCECDPKNPPVLDLASQHLLKQDILSCTEGESLAVAWALDNARMFVLGCRDLIVSFDHKPLLGIFHDRDHSSIPNDRISSLKEKTFCYQFSIWFCPGKWHRGPDAVSRNPSVSTVSLISIIRQPASIKDLNSLITLQEIQDAYKSDQSYQELAKTMANGFPKKRNETSPNIRDFWEVRDRLSLSDRIIYMDHRIVILPSLQKHVLYALHSAHHGVSGMKARANATIYWPGMINNIRSTCYNCKHCNETAPIQPREPLMATQSPDWPFQLICADYFELNNHSYLAIVDKFSGWLNSYHFKPGCSTNNILISTCRSLFIAYGAPEEISTDGGPQFMCNEFQNFSISGVLDIVDPLQTTLSQTDEQNLESRQPSDWSSTILNLMALLITTKQHKQSCNIATHLYLISTSALLKYCFTINYVIISLLTWYTTSFTKTGLYLQTNVKKR